MYIRLPFGLINAPAYFQCLMDETLTGHPAEAYLDDMVLADNDWKTHLKNLESLLQLARKKKISLKWKKCHFATARLDYLGHRVGSGEILPQQAKVQSILDFPKPKNLQSFLELVGYYRAHIPHFSTISASLSDLTKRRCPDLVQWTPELDKTFEEYHSTAPPFYGCKWSWSWCCLKARTR